jgi:hypothetical protein
MGRGLSPIWPVSPHGEGPKAPMATILWAISSRSLPAAIIAGLVTKNSLFSVTVVTKTSGIS